MSVKKMNKPITVENMVFMNFSVHGNLPLFENAHDWWRSILRNGIWTGINWCIASVFIPLP